MRWVHGRHHYNSIHKHKGRLTHTGAHVRLLKNRMQMRTRALAHVYSPRYTCCVHSRLSPSLQQLSHYFVQASGFYFRLQKTDVCRFLWKKERWLFGENDDFSIGIRSLLQTHRIDLVNRDFYQITSFSRDIDEWLMVKETFVTSVEMNDKIGKEKGNYNFSICRHYWLKNRRGNLRTIISCKYTCKFNYSSNRGVSI